MAAKQDQDWVTQGLQRPSQKFQPVDDTYIKPPSKVPPTANVTSNLEGARTDPELNQALLAHKNELVIVKYGSSFCYHCQQMLPHFLKLSQQYPQNHYVVAQLDHMKDAAQVDQFVAYEAQQLDDHVWLHSDDKI